GIAQMQQHPVPFVRPLSRVLEEKDARLCCRKHRVGRAQRFRNDRKTSADDLSICKPGSQYAEAVACAYGPARIAACCVIPACEVHAVVTAKVGSCHWRVKSDHACFTLHPQMQ